MKKIIAILILVLLLLISGCVQESEVIEGTEWFQTGNTQDITKLQPKQSNELEDNHIGIHAHCFWNPEGQGIFPDGVLDASNIIELGVKRARLGIKSLDAPDPDLLIAPDGDFEPELSIDPKHDEFITKLADNGITITYVLSFWDTEYVAQGGEVRYPRFKTEGEIQRYLDFVQFIVHHFKDRIQYYEIWNEPNIENTIQWIEVEDYINLVRRTVPVIKEEYPDAKIVVGGTSYLIDSCNKEYLFNILKSDIMPLVDVISWHGMYGTSPEHKPVYSDENAEYSYPNLDPLLIQETYYYGYPSIVQEIKDVASAHGFKGEYVGDELNWFTPDQAPPNAQEMQPRQYAHSETECAKYYARGIVMHLGIDLDTTAILQDKPLIFHSIQNLCTIMAGGEATSLPVEIESEATNIRSYTFSLSNGDKLIALWTDGIAVDEDPGVSANLTVQGITSENVTGIDVLNGYQQPITANSENGDLIIQNLIVRDYPVILRIS
jgi:hypothetical protein